jgi:hypothetical protein
MEPPREEASEMGKCPERSIADQDIARGHLRVQVRDMGRLMGAQRGDRPKKRQDPVL